MSASRQAGSQVHSFRSGSGVCPSLAPRSLRSQDGAYTVGNDAEAPASKPGLNGPLNIRLDFFRGIFLFHPPGLDSLCSPPIACAMGCILSPPRGFAEGGLSTRRIARFAA